MATLEEKVERIEDEVAIRGLVARFADGETRNDQDYVRKLWVADGVFTINEPNLTTFFGVDAIMNFLSQLRGSKEFFVQLIHSGIIEINGSTASARWLVREVARGGDKFYQTLGLFTDELVKHEGCWLFRERAYHYVSLDLSPFPGDTFALPLELQKL